MRRITKIFLLLATVALGFASCSNDNDEPPLVKKHIFYEVKAHGEHSERDAEIIFKGSYTNKKGEIVTVEAGEIPFKITLENVPADVRASFKGVLYSTNVKHIHMTISMKVVNALNQKIMVDNNKVVNLDRFSETAITEEELNKKTSFSFQE